MNKLSCHKAILITIGLIATVVATTRVRYQCLDPIYTGNRLSTSGHIRTVGGSTYLPGAPIFCSIDVNEIVVLKSTGNTLHAVQLNSPLVTRTSGLQHSSYESSTYENEQYSLNYSIGGKPFIITLYLQLFRDGFVGNEPNSDWIRTYANITWPNGVPATIDGWTTQYGVGFSVRLRPYFYHTGTSDYYRTMVNYAGNVPFYAPTFNQAFMNVTPGQEWGNTGFKTLARFSFDRWRGATTPLFDLQWVESSLTDREQWIHTFNASDNPISVITYNTNAYQTVSNGGQNTATHLPGFVNVDNGNSQCYFLVSMAPQPSTTGNVYAEAINIAQRRVGKRSIDLEWYAHNSTHAEPDYKHTGPGGGANNSVRDVLQSLLWDAGSDVVIGTSVTSLRCSDYNDFNNSCTIEELVAIEFATNPGSMYDLDYRRLDAAVYVLEGSQRYFSDPPGGSRMLGITMGGTHRAFVFPLTTEWTTKNEVYKALAHEIGHTLGMGHVWSECTEAQGWDCPYGTIMSYSPTYKMEHNADSRSWVHHAPHEWVDSRFGFGPSWSNSVEPVDICDWVPAGQW